MNIRIGPASIVALAAAIALWAAPPARADEAIAQAPAPAASPAASPSPSPSPPPKPFTLSGYADAGYTTAHFSTNQVNLYPAQSPTCLAAPAFSQSGCPNYISGRVFDTLNNQLQFHAFNLTAALLPQPVGFTVEFNAGNDASIINSYPKNTYAPGTDLDITQAFISLASGQFTGIVGKFETLAGAEVIESPNDWEISRSILFGYAVPFTHTGGRLTWTPNSSFTLNAGVNKGWDTTGTNSTDFDNNSLTIEGGANITLGNLNVVIDGYTGNVEEGFWTVNGPSPIALFSAICNPFVLVGIPTTQACAPGFTYNVGGTPNRSLIDTVETFKAGTKLTLKLNGDWGWQTNTGLLNNAGLPYGYGTANWFGVAGYANYAVTSAWSVTARGEYFYDGGGSRTGITQSWSEFTGTVQYSPVSEVILRAEFRGDHSNQPYFLNGQFPAPVTGYVNNYQFGFEAIGRFP